MNAWKAVIASGACLALSACAGGLLGRGKPVQLYQLQAQTPGTSAALPASERMPLRLQAVDFAPAIGGDRILAVRGQQAFFIKDARWTAAAPELFEQAVQASFAREAPRLLLTADATTRAAVALQVRVTDFEAVYAEGDAAPPMIRVAGDAILVDVRSRKPIGEREFVAEVPASANRVGPIVTAFGTASASALHDLVSWCRSVLAKE